MSTNHQDRTLPAPTVYPDNAQFWEAAGEGKLLVKKCEECSEVHYYPRPLCPFCGSARTAWQQASGKGTIYSVSVTRRAGPIPYAIAYVTLDEGVTLLTNIVDCDLDTAKIGDKVEVVFKPTDGGPPVPMFKPATA